MTTYQCPSYEAKASINNANDGIGTTIHRMLKIPSDPSSNVTYGMRDLYHRQQRLAYWIKRVNTDLEDRSFRIWLN